MGYDMGQEPPHPDMVPEPPHPDMVPEPPHPDMVLELLAPGQYWAQSQPEVQNSKERHTFANVFKHFFGLL